VYVGFRGTGIRTGIGIVPGRDCRIGGGRVVIRVEPTTKITRYLKNSEKPQPSHDKTTLDSEFDEILRKEQERIEKGKQDLGQIGCNSDNRDSGRDVAAELLKCKSRDRHIHSTKPN
jgi:hypothetical protein